MHRWSRLPLVLFRREGVDLSVMARRVRRRGRVWLATVTIDGEELLRAAVSNLATGVEDIRALPAELDAVLADMERHREQG